MVKTSEGVKTKRDGKSKFERISSDKIREINSVRYSIIHDIRSSHVQRICCRFKHIKLNIIVDNTEWGGLGKAGNKESIRRPARGIWGWNSAKTGSDNKQHRKSLFLPHTQMTRYIYDKTN